MIATRFPMRHLLEILLLPLLAPLSVGQSLPGPAHRSIAAPVAEASVFVRGTSTSALDLGTAIHGAGPSQVDVILAGVELLSILPSGFTTLLSVDPSRPRRFEVFPGVFGIELPQTRSRVVHYRRAGGTIFGFVAVTTAGDARVLIERSGVGPGGTADPFDVIIGVAPDGTRIAVAAPPPDSGPGGGDAFLLSIEPGALFGGQSSFELTGSAIVETCGASLTFHGPFLYANVDDALQRAPADGSGPLANVVLPPSGGLTPIEASEELLVSKDGSTLVLLAGVDEKNADLYVADLSGAIKNLTNNPGEIEPPGYLPEEVGGPYLGISADGSMIGYLREIQNENELFLLETAPGSMPKHVTDNAIFSESIDTPSGLFGSGALRMRFFADSGNQNADLYEAEILPTGALDVKNLTATSGAPAPFFPNAATLDVTASWNVSTDRWIADDAAQGFDLWRADQNGNAAPFATALSQVPAWSQAGDAWMTRLVEPGRTRLVRVETSQAPQVVVDLPAGIVLGDPALDASGEVVALRATVNGLDFVAAIDFASGAQTIGWGIFKDAGGFSFTPQGRVLFHSQDGGTTTLHELRVPSGKVKDVITAPVAAWLR